MNVGELHYALIRWEEERGPANATGSRYWIEGQHWGPRPNIDGTLFLRWDVGSGNYQLGHVERGKEHVTNRQESQQDACEAFYRMVTKEPSQVRNVGAEERSRGQQLADASQREVRARLAGRSGERDQRADRPGPRRDGNSPELS